MKRKYKAIWVIGNYHNQAKLIMYVWIDESSEDKDEVARLQLATIVGEEVRRHLSSLTRIYSLASTSDVEYDKRISDS